jgi:hypothetical protein
MAQKNAATGAGPFPGETPDGHEANVFLQAPDGRIVGAASCEALVREAAGRGDHCCSVAFAAQ